MLFFLATTAGVVQVAVFAAFLARFRTLGFRVELGLTPVSKRDASRAISAAPLMISGASDALVSVTLVWCN